MAYRAIATDLDGTLLRTDKSVSDRTRAAIHAAEDAGILVVIATGRPPRWIPPVIDELGERGLVVCANGATVYDPARHELVSRIELDPDVARGLVDDLEAALPDALLGVEQGFEFAVDEAIATREVELLDSWKIAGIRIGPIRSFLDQPVTKLILRLREAPEGTAARVQEIVGDRALVTHSTSEAFLELSHPSVHKASAVERLLAESGIAPADVVAFGDMPNDLELIRWAGHGVAVGNAHPVLKDAADEVTASNDEDGVAIVVERLLTDLATDLAT
ncbi:MAG: HAD-superfamily hydrolase, subfamily [Acidimicrobiales bacterium]|nr:HAD-superfamily hydrolase, subfamily [Acidimicrobiales bacterium]